jgi:hypothetical protein
VQYTLHSVLTTVPAAGVSGVLNVTPATESAVAQTLGTSPATVFDATDASTKIKAIDPAKLADAKAKLTAAVAAVLEALGQDSKVDLFTTAFAANGKGLDQLLDMIQFEASDDGAGNQDVVITNKTTKVGTKVSKTAKVEDVVKVSAPSKADVALDTSGIKTLLDAFNTQAKTQAGINSEAMLHLFDAFFLEEGINRAAMIQDIPVGMQISNFVLQGCDSEAKDGPECNVDLTDKRADGSAGYFDTKVKKGADGKWRIYGKQSPFPFDHKPVVKADYFVSNGLFAQSGSTQTGFNLWFPGKNDDDVTRKYKSATLQTSLDGGNTWSTPIKFAEKTRCFSNDSLSLDDSSNTSNATNCSNFVSVSNDAANAKNAAILKGQFRFKITAYTAADYTGNSISHTERSTKRYFTATTGNAALNASGGSVTAGDLGTNSVRFTGSPQSLSIHTETLGTSGLAIATGRTSWERDDLSALKGVVTIKAANDLCLANRNAKATCDASYGTDAKINSLYLDARDSQGRGILKGYFK